MVKPQPIMLGKAPQGAHKGTLGRARPDTPNIVGKGRRPFHDIKVWGGRFNNVKNKFMFNTTNFVGIPCLCESEIPCCRDAQSWQHKFEEVVMSKWLTP